MQQHMAENAFFYGKVRQIDSVSRFADRKMHCCFGQFLRSSGHVLKFLMDTGYTSSPSNCLGQMLVA